MRPVGRHPVALGSALVLLAVALAGCLSTSEAEPPSTHNGEEPHSWTLTSSTTSTAPAPTMTSPSASTTTQVCQPSNYNVELKRRTYGSSVTHPWDNEPHRMLWEMTHWTMGCLYFDNYMIGMEILDAMMNPLNESNTDSIWFETKNPGAYWAYGFMKDLDGELLAEEWQYFSLGGKAAFDKPCTQGGLDPCQEFQVYVSPFVDRFDIHAALVGEHSAMGGNITLRDADGRLVAWHEEFPHGGDLYLDVIPYPDLYGNDFATGGNWTIKYMPVVPTTTGIEFTFSWDYASGPLDGTPTPPGYCDRPFSSCRGPS